MNQKEQEKEIALLKANLDKAKEIRYKAEARLEQLEHQYNEILNELNELNIKPEQLDDEIKKLEDEIELMINKIKQLLPEELKEQVE
ncbi:MAG TPA: hypothetical protein GXX38_00845 [Clostridia bacterium]|nr:hypothetical protein [Clostridia bacterium]